MCRRISRWLLVLAVILAAARLSSAQNPPVGPSPSAPIALEQPPVAEYWWALPEFGAFWIRGDRLPPLVTASTPGTSLTAAGVLGLPSTSILGGGDRVNGETRAGGMLTLGTWLDDSQLLALQGRFMIVGGHDSTVAAGSDGSQIIARPFTDAATGAGAAELVSFPGVVKGTATVTASSGLLYGADVQLVRQMYEVPGLRCDFLFGYRFLYFDENLQIEENLTSLLPASAGANLVVHDRFATANTFNGGELGVRAELWRGPLTLELLARCAAGNVTRRVHITGDTTITVPATAPAISPGGLLALGSNTGVSMSNHIGFIPELGVTAGFQITRNFRATVGYSALWWTNIVRAGEQADLAVNPNLIPPPVAGGPRSPALAVDESNLWLQGVRFGLEFRY